MLQLKDIVKNYAAGENVVHALKGISLEFRKSEFVSILGPSGCGKTTLLNIIGGLDKYTSGDLVINGVSTKLYGDKDWDTYRNHSIGFVFQSYNLIPHQTVIENVELALTLSGVAKKEKRERAAKALERVGLGNQLHKLPNQLSGGQMQRVAIARALVNDPDIILADEPTGALDSETSLQVMQILKEISAEKLVIMVTHNPELAETYSTRIIRLLDGEVTEDSNPYAAVQEELTGERPKKKARMSFFTAFSLSLRNLFTKKGRTFLTSFAGSIGIIGIALILSLSSGFQSYIYTVQQDTLSNYPVTINAATTDVTAFINIGGEDKVNLPKYPDSDEMTSNAVIGEIFTSFGNGITVNDLTSFKDYLEKNIDRASISAIQYNYDFNYNIYAADGTHLNPYEIPPLLEGMMGQYGQLYTLMMQRVKTWSELIDNRTLLDSQYDVLEGSWPTSANELVVVVDNYNRIADYSLYQMGLKSENELIYAVLKMIVGSQFPNFTEEQINERAKVMLKGYGIDYEEQQNAFKFSEIIGKEYKLLLDSDYYVEGTTTVDKTDAEGNVIGTETVKTFTKPADPALSAANIQNKLENPAVTMKIVGVVRLKENVDSGAIRSAIAYTGALTDKIIDLTARSAPVVYQKENPDMDITTGKPFAPGVTLGSILEKLGYAEKDTPDSISIYPTSFENKDYIVRFIDEYNADRPSEEQIKYSDTMGVMMASITVIINAITYVLIAFVSISLVVSSIMIGIITYISVLERTKEIGVLRAIGASKKDIARVFNAETILVGLFAGVIGIGVTLVVNLAIISPVIYALSGIANVASLPIAGGIVLVAISICLTLIAGLIPSRVAARKDPVVALRSE